MCVCVCVCVSVSVYTHTGDRVFAKTGYKEVIKVGPNPV